MWNRLCVAIEKGFHSPAHVTAVPRCAHGDRIALHEDRQRDAVPPPITRRTSLGVGSNGQDVGQVRRYPDAASTVSQYLASIPHKTRVEIERIAQRYAAKISVSIPGRSCLGKVDGLIMRREQRVWNTAFQIQLG